MKKYLVGLFVALLPAVAFGFNINPNGTTMAPVAVSTAAVKVAECGQRSSFMICNQGSQTANTIGTNLMFCAPGPVTITTTGQTCGAAGTGGTTAPTAAGAGWVVFPGANCFAYTAPTNTTVPALQSEWDCICAATNGCEAYFIESP
jgi:hypothetical protein